MNRHQFRHKVKVAVAKVGLDSTVVDTVHGLPKIGVWEREHVPADCPVFDTREELHDFVQSSLIGDAPIDYLEFGVWEGKSVRDWTARNTHPDSRFVGFDSFEGLPEDWKQAASTVEANVFDVGGRVPQIDDSRVSWQQGWFQETVRPFLEKFETGSRVVMHCDADLYSSTLYALTQCDHILGPGSIILFDEFSSALNEFAALRDYCRAYQRDYDVIGVTSLYYAQIAIRMR